MISRETLEDLFSLCVGTMEKLMSTGTHEEVEKQKREDVTQVAPSADMQIVDVESK